MSDKTKTVAGERNPYRWVMLILVMLVYIVVLGFINQSFNLLIGQITDVGGWDVAQRTLVVGAFPTGMVFFVFIAGNVIDKFSVKKIMGICLILLAVLVFVRGFVVSFALWYAIMFIFGIVSAFYQPIITKVVTLWFPPEQLAMANGFTTASSPIGQIIANLLGLRIVAALSGGWRQLYIICGIIVFVLMIVWWIAAKERRNEDSATLSQQAKDNSRFIDKLKGVLSDPFVWCMIFADCFFMGLIYAGGTYSAYTLQVDPLWAATVDPVMTGYTALTNNITSMTAYIVTPLICAKISPSGRAYKYWVLISAIVAPIMFIIGYRTYSLGTFMALSAIAGAMQGGIVPGPKVLMLRRASVTGPRAGTAYGLMLTVERIFITVCTNVVGAIMMAQVEGQAQVMSNTYILMLLAAVFIAIGYAYDYSQRKKGKVGAEV